MKKRKICLAWHNLDSENYGVGALSLSHLIMIHKCIKKINQRIEINTLGTSINPDIKFRSEIEQKLNIKIEHMRYSFWG